MSINWKYVGITVLLGVACFFVGYIFRPLDSLVIQPVVSTEVPADTVIVSVPTVAPTSTQYLAPVIQTDEQWANQVRFQRGYSYACLGEILTSTPVRELDGTITDQLPTGAIVAILATAVTDGGIHADGEYNWFSIQTKTGRTGLVFEGHVSIRDTCDTSQLSRYVDPLKLPTATPITVG